MKRISQVGIELIQRFESCELEAYPDPGSELGCICGQHGLKMYEYRSIENWKALKGHPWTIGWGHTGPEVVPGLRWTRRQADRTFEIDLLVYERGVTSLLTRDVTQNCFDALVSFAYNCGLDIDSDTVAEGLGDSTLLRLVNSGEFSAAADEFLKWDTSNGRKLNGLHTRRLCERALFRGEDWRQAL
jgi:lysozyme